MNEPVWRAHPRARPLMGALALVALQVVALVVVTGSGLVTLVRGATSVSTTWGVLLFALVMAAVLALLGRAVAQGRGWARGPLITVELLAIFAGISTLRESLALEGVALALPAVVIVVLLFFPGVTAATTSEGRRRGAYSDGDTDTDTDTSNANTPAEGDVPLQRHPRTGSDPSIDGERLDG